MACAATAAAGPAHADPHLFLGFAEDWPKADGSAATAAAAQDLGATSVRITLQWDGEQAALLADDVAALDRAVATAGTRIVLTVFGTKASVAPQTETARTAYCTYVTSVLVQYPAIKDVIIWNEPNKAEFWAPQFNPDGSSAAPAAYQALLADCYDHLHAALRDVNVVGLALAPDGNDNPSATTNVSHSPGNFMRKVGQAYRGSARAVPFFDTVAHHVYGATSAERPWKRHPGTRIAQGDWDKLMASLHAGFEGTGQPLPGQCVRYRCVSIWYMEGGYETTIDAAHTPLYANAENVGTIPDDAGGEPDSPPPSADSPAPDQRTQILDGIRLAYCQNYVGAYINFLLRDEADLRGWQSGVLWADGTPKGSYDDLQAAIRLVTKHAIDCTALKGGLPPRPDTTPAAAPAGLRASVPPAETAVALDWADNPENDVKGYDVYRAAAAAGPLTKLNSAPIAGSAYVDRDVLPGNRYHYAVAAVDTAENTSLHSGSVALTVTHAPTTVTLQAFSARRAGRAVVLRWRTSASHRVLGFHVYRSQGRGRVRVSRALIETRSFRDRPPLAGPARYWLQIVQTDGTAVTYGPVTARRRS